LLDSNSQDNLETLSLATDSENLVSAIAVRICKSLDLEVILEQTVTEVRQFLQTDRVVVYRFEPDWSGLIVVESVVSPWTNVLGSIIRDPCFSEQHLERYMQEKVRVVEDIHAAEGLTSCHINFLANFEVKASLVVSIVAEDKLWGLLIAHHCACPRKWHSSEVELLKQLATQVGIAVQQAELYQQVQSLNTYLELTVKERTAKLEKSLQFEALVRNITEKVRDSLDETQILQTVTQEIGQVLNTQRCKIELYDRDCATATIAYEYSATSSICQGKTRRVADFQELYQQLLQRQSLQFVERIPELSPKHTQTTRLVCPIFDDRGILGNLWLLRGKEEVFDSFEMSLVEQVANQCAIAIRQARLYQESQVQVEELAKLNALKDDFLRTISHELRTPMSSIQLASQTLEVLLEKEIGANKSAIFTKVLDIFHSACKRQNQLVDDLLTLCYIDAKKEMMTLSWIDLLILIPEIIEPFYERTNSQNQKLVVNVASQLPLLKSDPSTIKRILAELLNNACKYTPEGETITFSVQSTKNEIEISVTNSGIEISLSEQERVFDKFYRIPNHDPWQYGGTGIGLALVKKLVELLAGTIQLDSEFGKTTFKIYFELANSGC
jgi:GAF domain-containing protein/anti-sigma regulatory factor (Ser/Thr protein kinase)